MLNSEQVEQEKTNFASGATARAFKGVFTDDKGSKHIVAIKEFVLQMTRRMQKKVDKEAKVLQNLNHPNILRFYGRIQGTSTLVTEFLEKTLEVDGETVSINCVRQLLDELEDDLPWPVRIHIALQTAKGLSYLHEAGCLHCDLKSGNVFIGSDYEREWIVKIGDFGEART